jgi:hypothetical protein
MAFCDFCKCDNCRDGIPDLYHAKTAGDRWICDVCWRYDVCTQPNGMSYPCEDAEGHAYNCPHRPILVSGWIAYSGDQ